MLIGRRGRLQDDSKIENRQKIRTEKLDERTPNVREQLKEMAQFVVSFQERLLHCF